MGEIDPILQITQVIQDVGIWAVFLYLFINERTSHNVTREKHMEDLREISGMKPALKKSPDSA